MELEGKVAVITGGSAGLGAALTRRFVEEGAAVSFCGRREEPIGEVCRAIEETGGHALGVVADVTDADDVARWIKLARAELGPIDVLVNNASVLGERVSVADSSLDTWREVLEVNLTGSFVVSKAVVPWLRETGGSLINVSSGVGDHGRSRWGAYSVSKNGLEAMSEIMAGELAEDGVRVNTVDPGGMRTSMRAAAYPDEDPLSLPPPYEATDVFVYLASDRSRDVTGERFRAREFEVSIR